MNEQTNRTRRKWNPDMLVAFVAVFVGACALAVSVYETTLFRKQ